MRSGPISLTVARIGGQPQTQIYRQVDSLGVMLDAFGETIETGKPFVVTIDEMLDVVAAFEAATISMKEKRQVVVQRTSS